MHAAPNEEIGSLFHDLEHVIQSIKSPVLFLGDFNCATGLVPGIQTSDCGAKFEDFILDSNLNFWIPNTPTRVCSRSSGYNDAVLTKQLHLQSAQVLNEITLFDHRYIRLVITASNPPALQRMKLVKHVLDDKIKQLELPIPS